MNFNKSMLGILGKFIIPTLLVLTTSTHADGLNKDNPKDNPLMSGKSTLEAVKEVSNVHKSKEVKILNDRTVLIHYQIVRVGDGGKKIKDIYVQKNQKTGKILGIDKEIQTFYTKEGQEKRKNLKNEMEITESYTNEKIATAVKLGKLDKKDINNLMNIKKDLTFSVLLKNILDLNNKLTDEQKKAFEFYIVLQNKKFLETIILTSNNQKLNNQIQKEINEINKLIAKSSKEKIKKYEELVEKELTNINKLNTEYMEKFKNLFEKEYAVGENKISETFEEMVKNTFETEGPSL